MENKLIFVVVSVDLVFFYFFSNSHRRLPWHCPLAGHGNAHDLPCRNYLKINAPSRKSNTLRLWFLPIVIVVANLVLLSSFFLVSSLFPLSPPTTKTMKHNQTIPNTNPHPKKKQHTKKRNQIEQKLRESRYFFNLILFSYKMDLVIK